MATAPDLPILTDVDHNEVTLSSLLAGRRVLVVGGTQFIGRATVEALVQAGANVTVVGGGALVRPARIGRAG